MGSSTLPAVPPRPRRGFAIAFGTCAWLFIMYRFKQDGSHHFFKHHPWEEPRMLAYLEEVDKKYGSSLATDNIHGHH
ncbi:hypothetical protein HK405_006538 [Cladochytrium tenue]|nr:hypothetical protein HK405_006538 [Cladochytrium tenue]